MTWGKGLLDEENLARQQQELAAGQNPWGKGLDLPEAETVAEASVSADPPAPIELIKDNGLSVVSIEQRLGEDPSWWPTALELELSRQNVRKSAMRAIVRTMEAEGADEKTVAAARAVLAEPAPE